MVVIIDVVTVDCAVVLTECIAVSSVHICVYTYVCIYIYIYIDIDTWRYRYGGGRS